MSRAEQIEKVISRVFYNLETGFQSQEKTYRKAVAEDPRVTRADVKRFLDNQEILQRKKPKGYNSWVPSFPRQQIQLDLAEFGKESEWRYMLIGIDSFSKKVAVVPLKTKMAESTGRAFKQILSKLGVPNQVVMDPGGEFQGPFKKYLEQWDIDQQVLRTGGRFVERAIRTVKEGVFKRLDALGLPRSEWYDVVGYVVNQINSTVHETTKGIPNYVDALRILDDDEYSEIKWFKQNMQDKAIRQRRYPKITVGSRVKVIRKPGKKSERKGQWSDFLDSVETVTKMARKGGNTVYYITGREEPLLRHELLFLPDVRASPLKTLTRKKPRLDVREGKVFIGRDEPEEPEQEQEERRGPFVIRNGKLFIA